jgi:DNA-binding CsgD family transcriptional regulator
MGHRRLGSDWPRCAGCQEPVRSSARRQAPRLGQADCGLRFPLFGKPSSLALTHREAEVLALVAEGRTNRQIGQALFITPKTAGVHVSRILAKLGVTGRGEAAAIAHRLGLDKH